MKKIIMLFIILPCVLRAGLTELYIQSCKNQPLYKMSMVDIDLIDKHFFTLFSQFNLNQSFDRILEERGLAEMVRKHEPEIVQLLEQDKPESMFSFYIPSARAFTKQEIFNSEKTPFITNITFPRSFEYSKKKKSLIVMDDNQKIIGCIKELPTLPSLIKSVIPCTKKHLYFIIRSTFRLDEPLQIDIWDTIKESFVQNIPLDFIPKQIVHGYLGTISLLILIRPDQEDAVIFEQQKMHLLKSVMLLMKLSESKDPQNFDVSQWHPDWSNEFILLPEWAKAKFPDYTLKKEFETKKRNSPLSLRTSKTQLTDFPKTLLSGRKTHSADLN